METPCLFQPCLRVASTLLQYFHYCQRWRSKPCQWKNIYRMTRVRSRGSFFLLSFFIKQFALALKIERWFDPHLPPHATSNLNILKWLDGLLENGGAFHPMSRSPLPDTSTPSNCLVHVCPLCHSMCTIYAGNVWFPSNRIPGTLSHTSSCSYSTWQASWNSYKTVRYITVLQ